MHTHHLHTTGVLIGPLGHDQLLPPDLIRPEHGAVASFIGAVRNEHLGKSVTHLVYDCYQPMAERVLADIVAEAAAQDDDTCRIACWHGTGHMDVGAASVAIHVASGHRVAAFAACRQVIERIKEDLPVWKQEFYDDGTDSWLKGS